MCIRDSIRSVQKQIAEAESQFRLAAAGVEGFEQSAEGLTVQLTTLERRLTLCLLYTSRCV